jgi:hypothetical protein
MTAVQNIQLSVWLLQQINRWIPTQKIQFVLEEQNLSSIKRLPDFVVRLLNKVKLLGLQWPFVLITVQI